MSKLEDKLTASIKPNQRKAAVSKPSAKAKPATTEAETPQTPNLEQAEKVVPKAAPKPKNTSSDAHYILPTKRVWPD